MRPIRLTMEAFGSYGEKTVIDFSDLNQNLFLISGETGSGKSTIFDAISFALYGEASSTRNKRDGKELQSDFAGYTVTPFVELVFSKTEGGIEQLYTVRREPQHERKITRKTKTGNTTTSQSEKVTLIMPDGTEYPQKEANVKIISLVGLSKNQFAQIVMIAQGEFMELLRADSKTKKEIFRKLFGTEIFERIVEELARRSKEAYGKISTLQTAFKTEIAGISLPEGCLHGEELILLREQLLNSDKLNVTDLERLTELLTDLCDALAGETENARAGRAAAAGKQQEAQEAYTKAETLRNAFEQLSKAEEDLQICESRQKEMNEAGILAGQIRSAGEIAGVYRGYTEAQNRTVSAQEKLTELKAELPALKEQQEAAAKTEREAEEKLHVEQRRYAKLGERVHMALETFAGMEAAQKAKAQALLDAKLAEEKAEKCRRNEETYDRQVKEWRVLSEQLKDAALRKQAWQEDCRKAKELRDEAMRVQEAHRDAAQQAELLLSQQKAYGEASQKFREKKAQYDQKYILFLDAQAGLLARDRLKVGSPCPVCGSMEHPAPCILSDEHKELTRELMDALQEETENLRRDMEKKANAAGSGQKLLTEKQKTAESMLEALRKRIADTMQDIAEDITFSEIRMRLNEWIKALSEQKETVEVRATEQQKLHDVLEGCSVQQEKYRAETEAAKEAAALARETLAKAEAACEELQKQQKEFRTAGEASEALQAGEIRQKETENRYREAKKQLETAGAKKEQTETLILKYTEELPGLLQQCQTCRDEYESCLTAKEMKEETWKSLAERYDPAEADRLDKTVKAHDEKKAAARASADTARLSIGNQGRPDMQALEAARETAQLQWMEADRILQTVQQAGETNNRIRNSLVRNQKDRRDFMKQYEQLQGLFERLGGKRTGARMDIETFVQRYHLARILDAANERFRDMTEGQFELRMMPEEQAGSGKNRGLDLMVYSSVTGKEREIRTLSGGESFMAALALSLGIADQIQTGSAVNIDMMFIDEGFGSLSANARTQAVQVLQKMSAGSKMIGIISHVSELQQMIEDQLVVRKDERGSHVKWQIS